MLFGDQSSLKGLHAYMDALSEAKDFIGVNIERRMLVLKWLHIFGYSDREIILKLIDRPDRGGYRFITDLIRHGYIQKFENTFYGKDLFMLDKKGVGLLLESAATPTDKTKVPNKRKFMTTNMVAHEVGLHKSVIASLDHLSDGRRLINIDKEVRCKALMLDVLMNFQKLDSEATLKIGLEYERADKSRRRTEFLLVEHMKNIAKEQYDLVIFSFTEKRLHDYFIKILIDKPKEWSKSKEKGTLYNGIPYNDQSHNNSLYFMLLSDDKMEITNLAQIKELKTHRLHSYLVESEQKEKNDALSAEKERERLEAQEMRSREKEEQKKRKREQEDKELAKAVALRTTEEILKKLLHKYENRNLIFNNDFKKYLTGEKDINKTDVDT